MEGRSFCCIKHTAGREVVLLYQAHCWKGGHFVVPSALLERRSSCCVEHTAGREIILLYQVHCWKGDHPVVSISLG